MANYRKETGDKGVSTVFGSILFIIIIIAIASSLLISLDGYNRNVQELVAIEEDRKREKITIDQLLLNAGEDETQYITAIQVSNMGSVASKIRAIYIDNTLISDPETYIDAKEKAMIEMPPETEYAAISTISVTTERGVKSMILEGDLVENYPPPPEPGFYFGPLKLEYEEFYYIKYNADGISYDPLALIDGWNPPKGTNLVWRITVQNIGNREIALTKYSCLTLVDNAGGNQLPWYMEKIIHSDGSSSTTILPTEKVDIFYRWNDPRTKNSQKTFSSESYCRVFLTFFGAYVQDEKTTPYGQTIPFEAVLIY